MIGEAAGKEAEIAELKKQLEELKSSEAPIIKRARIKNEEI